MLPILMGKDSILFLGFDGSMMISFLELHLRNISVMIALLLVNQRTRYVESFYLFFEIILSLKIFLLEYNFYS
ncbi:hypothetical protein JOC76_005919 [Neobacillus cucumis]|nr:hypothetical protein [Neobacillus cucumis]